MLRQAADGDRTYHQIHHPAQPDSALEKTVDPAAALRSLCALGLVQAVWCRLTTASDLLDMVGAMRAIGEFVQDRTYESYQTDLFFRSAVERQLEILGEAANRLNPKFQAAHSEVDWSNVVGLRNVIIHQYDEIDYEEI